MKLIVGNWKMFPQTLDEAKVIFAAHRKSVKGLTRAKIVLCPPSLFIEPIAKMEKGKRSIVIGAQNAFYEDEGARTGEISPPQVRSVGATYVILGHSERRALGETDEVIAKKAIQANKSKLTVILCVGERSRDEAGSYFNEVKEQLRKSLADFPRSESKRLVIAYEPIWAIGKNAVRSATSTDFHEMSILIKRHLVDQFGKAAGFKVPILYGGSVDEKNAEGFLKDGGADGLLVGRISLDREKFGMIMKLAHKIK